MPPEPVLDDWFLLLRPNGTVAEEAPDLPTLIVKAESRARHGRSWLGLMASGWDYQVTQRARA